MVTRVGGSIVSVERVGKLYRKKVEIRPVRNILDKTDPGSDAIDTQDYRLGEAKEDIVTVIDDAEHAEVILGSENLCFDSSYHEGLNREVVFLKPGETVVVEGLGEGMRGSVSITHSSPPEHERMI